jgi:hypothetical protein
MSPNYWNLDQVAWGDWVLMKSTALKRLQHVMMDPVVDTTLAMAHPGRQQWFKRQ